MLHPLEFSLQPSAPGEGLEEKIPAGEEGIEEREGKKGELQKRVGRWATLDESRNEREESLHSANKILGRTRIQNNKLFESNDDGHLLIHVFI